MKVFTTSYRNGLFTPGPGKADIDNEKVQLVLGFGTRQILIEEDIYGKLLSMYPVADILLASTAGEIFNDCVLDNTVAVTAIEFEHTWVHAASVNIADHNGNSREAGIAMVRELPHTEDLCYIMLISDGEMVNGSELVDGIGSVVGHSIPVTGGMAGDGIDFNTTVVGLNGQPQPGVITAIALYGGSLVVNHCTMGGYETFGPEIVVTCSSGNRLFRINDENALELYKKYLGPYAGELPGSALLFPLSVKLDEHTPPVVRTILSIDAEEGCMTFAGDIPQGAKIRFMKANFDKLIEAASEAASGTLKSLVAPEPTLAILISCVGRKIILDSRIDEEVEAVREIYSGRTVLTGFYSYGELCPLSQGTPCELHNQTITITTFDEC